MNRIINFLSLVCLGASLHAQTQLRINNATGAIIGPLSGQMPAFRTSLGLGIGDTPRFGGIGIGGDGTTNALMLSNSSFIVIDEFGTQGIIGDFNGDGSLFSIDSSITGARINITDGKLSGWKHQDLSIQSTNGLEEVDGSISTLEDPDDPQHRFMLMGLNMTLVENAGAVSWTREDPGSTGWGFMGERDYFDLYGVLQHEAYLTTSGAERPFIVGFAASVPVTVPNDPNSITNPGGTTTQVTFTAHSEITDYLRVGMRVRFTALTNPTGALALNTPYLVKSIVSPTSFVIADVNNNHIVGDADSGTLDRGGWGLMGNYVPVFVDIGDASRPYSNYFSPSLPGGSSQPIAYFGNSVSGHHAAIAIANNAANSHQAFIDFDNKWRAGNGAVYGNLSTSFDISPETYSGFVGWSMDIDTGFVKMGYATDADGVAPTDMLDVNGVVKAVSGFTNGASGPTWKKGTGSPEGVVTAPVGSLFSRTDGGAGTSFYVKESGVGNTGWVAK